MLENENQTPEEQDNAVAPAETPQPEEIQHTITQQDLDNNPGLEEHAAVGDTVGIPKTEESDVSRPNLDEINAPEESKTEESQNPVQGLISDFHKEFNGGHDFSTVLDALKDGSKVKRSSWQGRHLELVDGAIMDVQEDQPVTGGWSANQTDILSEDWVVL